jgi:hypothetical protein
MRWRCRLSGGGGGPPQARLGPDAGGGKIGVDAQSGKHLVSPWEKPLQETGHARKGWLLRSQEGDIRR